MKQQSLLSCCREKRFLLTLLLLLAAFSIVLQSLPDAAKLLIRYDRGAIANGEWWRLVSGHFLHLGWIHLALNLAGLTMISTLFWRYWSAHNLLLVFVISLLAVSTGLWWYAIEVRWYVGLSGVLHGLLIAGAALSFGSERWFSLTMIAIVCGKITWEQITRSSAGTAELIGGNVLFDAHLYGFIGGLLSIIIIFLISHKRVKP